MNNNCLPISKKEIDVSSVRQNINPHETMCSCRRPVWKARPTFVLLHSDIKEDTEMPMSNVSVNTSMNVASGNERNRQASVKYQRSIALTL